MCVIVKESMVGFIKIRVKCVFENVYSVCVLDIPNAYQSFSASIFILHFLFFSLGS